MNRERAIAMLLRKHGATSYHVRENGDLIMSRGSGKKMVQLRVPSSRLEIVEECIRTGRTPFRNELEATQLGRANSADKARKQNPKRMR
jgi:hypothetical protein